MQEILAAIKNGGGQPLFVGGCVRDSLLGNTPKDFDIEVYGLPINDLMEVLRPFGPNMVGVSFGVIKIGELDISIPRKDNYHGKNHNDLSVTMDHTMSIEEAASRRDFTINSLAMCPFTKEIIDPFGGINDLKDQILRKTSDKFSEDPLRVLRGFQFAGRFDMVGEPHTFAACNKLSMDHLAVERINGEVVKWATKSIKPSKGLMFLKAAGWLQFFPELQNLDGLPQDPIWHPEGDVFTHTALVCDEAMKIAERDQLDQEDTLVLLLAALCHDLGKANTTQIKNGRIVSPGHNSTGVPLTRSLLSRMGFQERIQDQVCPLVEEHMVHLGEITPRTVRRLSVRLGDASISQLVRLIEADHSGRSPLPKVLPEKAGLILQLAEELAVTDSKPLPIVQGRHLLQMMRPGPQMGLLLKELYQQQLDGDFQTLEQGLEIARTKQ